MHLDNPQGAGTTRHTAMNRSEHPLAGFVQLYVSQHEFLKYLERRTPVNHNDELLILWLQDLN